ncbi:MAG: hypothetical protein ACYSTF_07100, partial [Planctomycetota bacterium]
YVSKNSATAVCVDMSGQDKNILGCFSVSVEEQEEHKEQVLSRLVAEGCAERELEFSEAAVALDCALFMQHNLHSEFKDPKQIAATVRFDTEEALSTDVSDVAIAFRVVSSNESGSELTVFTAQQKILSDVLLSLQGNNIDPTTVEPDVYCLSRFISQNVASGEDTHCLYGMLSQHSGYFLGFGDSQQAPSMRTFLINPAQDRGSLLGREVPLTVALAGSSHGIDNLKILDSKQSVNHQQLGERLGLQCGGIDLAGSVATSEDKLADCAGPVDLAIAYGAALAHQDTVESVNFRNDFMPHQGKKVRMQKAFKFMSVSVSFLMVALGIYVTSQLWRTSKDRVLLRKTFKPDYVGVMAGDKRLPATSRQIIRKLDSERTRTRKIIGKTPIGGGESVSAKLALVLGAFNDKECAKKAKLEIKEMVITAKEISIVGSTSSKRTGLLRTTLEKNGLEILHGSYGIDASKRETFRIALVPKR